MASKDRTLDTAVYQAAVNLRVAGMSERAIYEGLRDVLAEPPSYRDLRVAYSTAGVRYRSEAAAARSEGRYLESRDEGKMERSFYLSRREEVLKVDKTVDAKESFDRRYLLGYLARENLASEAVDVENQIQFAESVETIYDGLGS